MRVLLDTTALYVAAGITTVSFTRKVEALLRGPETVRLVSSVSLTEIAIKSGRGLVPLTSSHVAQLVHDAALTELPFTVDHAFRMFDLPLHHPDPFDRMLISAALAEDVPIVSRDREFSKYRGLRVIW